MQLGCIRPERVTENIGGVRQETTILHIVKDIPYGMSTQDELLYTFLTRTVDHKGVVRPNRMAILSEGKADLLRQYLDACHQSGVDAINQLGYLDKWRSYGKVADLTPSGRKALGEILGFKRYVESLSEVAKESVEDKKNWQSWMSVAVLLGCAKQLAEELKILYPEMEEEVEMYYTYYDSSYMYYQNMYYRMQEVERKRAEAAEAARDSGSGGSMSSGGGGGSIGGGSGGGSR